MADQSDRPYVWQMIKEAVETIGRRTTPGEIRRWVLRAYPGTNLNTLNTQINVCTVNSKSRVHSPQNQRPRISDRPQDLLFRVDRGLLELYAPAIHGTWGIVEAEDGALGVQCLKGPGQTTTPPSDVGSIEASRRVESICVSRQSSQGHRYEQATLTNRNELLANAGHYYEASLAVSRMFGGPSEYFHARAIQAARSDFLSERHLEYAYATLASWGMHRMGNTKCKMVGFDEFRGSVEASRDQLVHMRHTGLASVTCEELDELLASPMRRVFDRLSVSVSESKLVANSKALHHLLPDLVPPIDWQYTVRFFYFEPEKFVRVTRDGKRKWRQVNVQASIGSQHIMFVEVCRQISGILRAPEFKAIEHLVSFDGPFNTSLPKIVDNMIVAYVRDKAGMRTS